MSIAKLVTVVSACVWAMAGLCAQAEKAQKTPGQWRGLARATLVLHNARVWTGVDDAPEAEAVAVAGDRIIAVGTSEAIRSLAGEGCVEIDAGGRRVIPGITDSHTHIIATGLQLTRLELRNASSKREFVDAIAASVTRLRPGQWLLGGRYSVESWDDPQSPHKEWIDALTPATPVFLTRMDGHQTLTNSVALEFARIDRNGPPDPPGGEIERDPETGEPTGILKDDAMALVSKHIPPPDKRKKYEALKLAMQVAAAWGITSIHDMSEPDDLPVFLLAKRRGVLTLRVRSYVQTDAFEKTLPVIQALAVEQDDMFRVAGFKAYMDGSLGSRTAYMREPYSDSTKTTKYPRGLRSGHASDLQAFSKQIRWVHERGLQMAIHAIGDEAIHEVLDIYESLPDVATRRHRIEHAQHLLPEDVSRFARLGVIASMQPFHKADDGRYAEKAIGPIRAKTSYAFKSLLRSGATVCFGSDCPVVTNNPFAGIAAAVSGKTMHGDVWIPEQSISRVAALKCYTSAPAFAALSEDKLGTIEVGRLADLVVLDGDVLADPIDTIHGIESYVTIMGGNIVYRSAAAARKTEPRP